MDKAQNTPVTKKMQEAIESLLRADDFLVVTYQEFEQNGGGYKTEVLCSRIIALGSLVEIARQVMADKLITFPADDEEGEIP